MPLTEELNALSAIQYEISLTIVFANVMTLSLTSVRVVVRGHTGGIDVPHGIGGAQDAAW
jgi:hypothetical protein